MKFSKNWLKKLDGSVLDDVDGDFFYVVKKWSYVICILGKLQHLGIKMDGPP